MMDFETPYNLIISLNYSLAILIVFVVFLQGIKCVIFEYLSTTTKTKSIEISSQICSGIGKGMYKPMFYDCPIAV